ENTPLQSLLIPSFKNPEKFQFANIHNEQMANIIFALIKFTEKPKLDAFIEKTALNGNEIKETLNGVDVNMARIFDAWDNSDFNKFELPQVGIAIAHANYRRRTNESMVLSIWIK